MITTTQLTYAQEIVPPLTTDFEFSSEQLLQSTVTTHDLCFICSEQFISPWLRSEITDTGPVREQVLGAQVVGNQQTFASTSVDFVPSSCSGRLLIRLNGTTSNQTISYTPQAAIQSVGDYQFELTKEIDFRSNQFTTRSPSAFLTMNQRNLGAATQLSQLPILGPLANQTALNIANQQTPRAQQIAAIKLTNRVAPRFNSEVDQRIAPLNHFLKTTLPGLIRPTQLQLPEVTARTSNQHLIIATSIDQNGGRSQTPSWSAGSPVGASLLVNESLLNSLIGKVPLAGWRISDTRLKALLEGKFQNFLVPAKPRFVTLIFDDQEPLSVHFDQGEIHIAVRMTVKPVLGPDIKRYQVVVSLQPEVEAQSIRLTPTIQSIGSLDPESGMMGGMVDTQIRDQLQRQIEPVVLPKRIGISSTEPQHPKAIQIEGIQISSGWLKIDADNSIGVGLNIQPLPSVLRDNFIQIQK